MEHNSPHPLHLSLLSQCYGNDSEAPPYSQSSKIQLYFAICRVNPQYSKKRLCETSNPQVCNFKSIYVDFSFLPNHIFPSKTIWFPCLSVQDTSTTFSNFLSHLMVIFHQEIKFFSLWESPCLHDDQRTVCSV